MATVVRRDGTREPVQFDKILARVAAQCVELARVDAVRVAQRVVQGVHDGVTTRALDELASETAAALACEHPEYSTLAARIAITRLHKSTSASFACVHHVLSDEVRAFAETHADVIDKALVFERDLSQYDYFGFKTLERSYLTRGGVTGDEVIERPQVLLMRVSLGIHCGDLEAALETYDYMSRSVFTHATPTMFNSGTRGANLASCFLLPIIDDSIGGIFETTKRCALISKSAGGIGFSVSNVRAKGSRIASTGGKSSGLLPMLQVFERTARYVDQGGGKRPGAFAAYLEPWHADVRTFLDMKKNHGAEELRARDLFYALWIPDLFMRRVAEDTDWTLFCPSKCPDLIDKYGVDFDTAYEDYERTPGCAVDKVRAQELWLAILDAQIETGTPYMLYKDACNLKSNQKNLGTIRSSNLCTEIIQYSASDEIATCNLASLSLPAFLEEDGTTFSYGLLARATSIVTRNLNKVIDRNVYACTEAHASNMRHRPIGIGIQGLADVFARLSMSFDGPEAREMNKRIFETIYFASLSASCALAAAHGTYESYEGSPASKGLLQFDLWKEEKVHHSGLWDWESLKEQIKEHGLRNSLLVAPMPTASTAQIMGNNECFEPFTSNVYVRRVRAGEFPLVNKHLVRDLEARGLWSEAMRRHIIASDGSVQGIATVPDDLKAVYKTAWEMSMRTIIDMAADRGVYVDQSQSMNLFVAHPTHRALSSMHMHAWKKGLKTGMYYLRTRAAAEAVQVTIPVNVSDTVPLTTACRRDDPGCLACSA